MGEVVIGIWAFKENHFFRAGRNRGLRKFWKKNEKFPYIFWLKIRFWWHFTCQKSPLFLTSLNAR